MYAGTRLARVPAFFCAYHPTEPRAIETMKTLCILNRGAGSADDPADLKGRIAAALRCDVEQSDDHADARRRAREAPDAGYERVIAAGGDGTIGNVLNGLAPHFDSCTFGVIPLGTGNDFARALYPEPTLDAALAALSAGHTRPLDVGRITRRARDGAAAPPPHYFANFAAGGFSARATEELNGELKQKIGALAFAVGVAKALPDLAEYELELELDGRERALRAYNLMLANGPRVAGGIPVAPAARLDDGLLDLLVIPALSLARLALMIPQILVGRHLDNTEDLVIERVAHLRVRARPMLPLTADGESLGDWDADYDVLPGVLRTVVAG